MVTLSNVNAVLRILDVKRSRAELEAVTGPLNRFEAEPNGTAYAQIDAPEDCTWADVTALVERVGPALLRYSERQEIGRPSLDVALFIGSDRVAASSTVPTEVVAALARFGFELEISAYLSGNA